MLTLTECMFVYLAMLLTLYVINAIAYGIERAMYDVTGHTYQSMFIELQLASMSWQSMFWDKVDSTVGVSSNNPRYFK